MSINILVIFYIDDFYYKYNFIIIIFIFVFRLCLILLKRIYFSVVGYWKVCDLSKITIYFKNRIVLF